MTLSATGTLDDDLACNVQTGRALAKAGLHPATGGDGSLLCSGDMLLEALVACAGVTLQAPSRRRSRSTSRAGHDQRRGRSRLPRHARRRPRRPGRLRRRPLRFDLDAPGADDDQLATLLKLTERYCVVLQTLRAAPPVTASLERVSS